MPKQNRDGAVVLSALELDLMLSLGNGELYGLELLEYVNVARQAFGMSELRIGSLYPTLKRLEKSSLIKGEWRVVNEESHRRKYY